MENDQLLYQAGLRGLETKYIERTIPRIAVEPCFIKCKSCKRFIDIDYGWVSGQDIEGGNIFDLDCPHCWSQNCISSTVDTRKIRTFRKKCERWLMPKTTTCARVPSRMRFEVLARDRFTCQYCGAQPSDGTSLHVDHMVAFANGGTTTFENLITACAGCNAGKGDRAIDEFD